MCVCLLARQRVVETDGRGAHIQDQVTPGSELTPPPRILLLGPSMGPRMPPPIHLVILVLLAPSALAGRPEVMQIVAGEQQQFAKQHSGSSNTQQQQWVHNAVEYPLMGDNEQIPEIPKSGEGFNNIPGG